MGIGPAPIEPKADVFSVKSYWVSGNSEEDPRLPRLAQLLAARGMSWECDIDKTNTPTVRRCVDADLKPLPIPADLVPEIV